MSYATRSLDSLHPVVANKVLGLLRRAEAVGITLLVTCAWRSAEAQDALYAQGRTKPGKKVTNARAGESLHNWRCAVDVVPIRHGKCVWGTTGENAALWQTVGRLGQEAGLEWAGAWKGSLREYCHFQYTGGLTLSQLQAGRVPL